MSTMSSILNTSLNGLLTYQNAIGITSTNISNVDTEGYSRQSVHIRDASQTGSDGLSTLSGLQTVEAVRVANLFAIQQVIDSATEMGRLEKENEYMAYVEALFNESEGAGINDALSEFWCSWEDLVNNPSGDTERSVLASNAAALADRLNQLTGDLEELQQEIDREIAAGVDEVNRITTQIAELNETLVQYQAKGRDTSSIQDSLDYLTEQLSTLVNVNTYQNSDGQVCVQLADGKPLVQGTRTWSLETSLDPGTGLFDVVWNDGYGNTEAVQDGITSGVLGGCLSVRDEYIPAYLDDLNELGSTLITEVNTLLVSGYDLEGQPGIAMFTGTDAEDIAVDQQILDDPGLIAAAGTAASAPGDGSVAQAIAELRNSNLVNGGTATLDEFYSVLVSQVGLEAESVQSDYDQQSNLDEFYRNFKESISGVSLDEESANLVLYQQAYEASARVITLLQELMEITINM